MNKNSSSGAPNKVVRKKPAAAGRGRPKGTPNKTTAMVKDAIADAAKSLGGAKRLAEWAGQDAKNEFAFWTSIYPKLLPLQIAGEGKDGALIVELIRFSDPNPAP